MPNNKLKTGNMCPSKRIVINVYWAKRPSISPPLKFVSRSIGIQSWLPHIKLKINGIKVMHRKPKAISQRCSSFFDNNLIDFKFGI